MLWSCLLCGHSGCCHAALSCGHCHCVATVGVMSHCCGGHRCAAFCVAGAIVAWPWWVLCCMAMVGVIVLCFVLQVLLLRGRSGHCIVVAFVAWLQWVSLCCVALQSGLLRGCSGCCRAMWDCGDWTAKEEISRKKRKEKKKNAPESMPA